LQASQAIFEVAVSPLLHSVAATAELFGHAQVGGLVGLGDTEDEVTTKGEALGCGAGADEPLEAFAFAVAEGHNRGVGGRHGDASCAGKQAISTTLPILRRGAAFVHP
jgi:hypothetical protein